MLVSQPSQSSPSLPSSEPYLVNAALRPPVTSLACVDIEPYVTKAVCSSLSGANLLTCERSSSRAESSIPRGSPDVWHTDDTMLTLPYGQCSSMLGQFACGFDTRTAVTSIPSLVASTITTMGTRGDMVSPSASLALALAARDSASLDEHAPARDRWRSDGRG